TAWQRRRTCSQRRARSGDMLQLLTALAMGGAVTAFLLWATGWQRRPVVAAERLSRIRNEEHGGNPLQSLLALRRRVGGVRLGGVNVVSVNIAQNWQRDLERAGLTLTVREYFIFRLTAGLV